MPYKALKDDKQQSLSFKSILSDVHSILEALNNIEGVETVAKIKPYIEQLTMSKLLKSVADDVYLGWLFDDESSTQSSKVLFSMYKIIEIVKARHPQLISDKKAKDMMGDIFMLAVDNPSLALKEELKKELTEHSSDDEDSPRDESKHVKKNIKSEAKISKKSSFFKTLTSEIVEYATDSISVSSTVSSVTKDWPGLSVASIDKQPLDNNRADKNKENRRSLISMTKGSEDKKDRLSTVVLTGKTLYQANKLFNHTFSKTEYLVFKNNVKSYYKMREKKNQLGLDLKVINSKIERKEAEASSLRKAIDDSQNPLGHAVLVSNKKILSKLNQDLITLKNEREGVVSEISDIEKSQESMLSTISKSKSQTRHTLVDSMRGVKSLVKDASRATKFKVSEIKQAATQKYDTVIKKSSFDEKACQEEAHELASKLSQLENEYENSIRKEWLSKQQIITHKDAQLIDARLTQYTSAVFKIKTQIEQLYDSIPTQDGQYLSLATKVRALLANDLPFGQTTATQMLNRCQDMVPNLVEQVSDTAMKLKAYALNQNNTRKKEIAHKFFDFISGSCDVLDITAMDFDKTYLDLCKIVPGMPKTYEGLQDFQSQYLARHHNLELTYK